MLSNNYNKTSLCLSVSVWALLTVGARTSSAYTMMGSVESYGQDGYNITFNCESGRVRLSFLTDSIVRVHMAPAGQEFPEDTLHLDDNGPYAVVNYTWPGVQYQISEGFDPDLEGLVYTIRAGRITIRVRKQPCKLAFYRTSGELLVMEKEGIVNAGLGHEGSKVYETMHLPDDEHFFGFGAHNHPLDMRGKTMTCYARELEGRHEAGGFPAPFFMSSKGYGIFFNNLDDDVTFKMGATPGEYSLEGTSGRIEGWDMDYYLIYGPRFGDILNRYTDIVGKPMLPEKWYFGHIQVHCTWLEDMIIESARRYREGGWPCDVFVMDFQSLGPGFTWAEGHPNPGKMYETLGKYGIKTGFSCALFDDVYEWKGFDPTRKEQMDKYFEAHLPRIRDGMDFWRQDNAERSERYTGLKILSNGYEAHNLFGSLWAKGVVERMASMGLLGRAVISRGGPVGGHRYIVPWPGDTPHGLRFLDIDLNFMRNGGLSLYSSISVDLGGFTDRGEGKPLEEQNVVRRIINMMPVAPVSKFQGANDASAPFPWLFTEQQQDLFRFYLKLRYRLHPYYYSCAIEAHQTGRPILAPLVFDYQDDEKTYDKDFHFMLGRQVLVAPVMEKTEKWNVYLPEGKWIHYWTGKAYAGGRTVTVDAPLYSKAGLPMFIKAGAIIPMMPEMNYIYERAPEPITLDVYPDKACASEYVMYDCEKVTGPTEKTLFKCSEDEKQIKISVGGAGTAYELWVHHDKEPASVAVDSMPLPKLPGKTAYDSAKAGWFYGPGCLPGSENIKTVNVRIPKASAPCLLRIVK
jgi:alpha-glucosidase (family GH31 glycosyl hydrolase)